MSSSHATKSSSNRGPLRQREPVSPQNNYATKTTTARNSRGSPTASNGKGTSSHHMKGDSRKDSLPNSPDITEHHHAYRHNSVPNLRVSLSPLSMQKSNVLLFNGSSNRKKRKSVSNGRRVKVSLTRDESDDSLDEKDTQRWSASPRSPSVGSPLLRSSTMPQQHKRTLSSPSTLEQSSVSMQLESLTTRHHSLSAQFSTLQAQYQSSQRKVSSLGVKLQQTLAHISHLQHLNSLQHAKIKNLQKKLKSKNMIAIQAAEDNKLVAAIEEKWMGERVRREQVELELEELRRDRDSWRNRSLETEKIVWRHEREVRNSQQQLNGVVGSSSSWNAHADDESSLTNAKLPSAPSNCSSLSAHHGRSDSNVLVMSDDNGVHTQPLLIRSKQMVPPRALAHRRRSVRSDDTQPRGGRTLRSAGSARRHSHFSGLHNSRDNEQGLASLKHGFKVYRRASDQDQLNTPDTLDPWGNESPGLAEAEK